MQLLTGAAHLVAVHGLRSVDAIQLPSALHARQPDPAIDVLASFDARLTAAAAAEGFPMVSA